MFNLATLFVDIKADQAPFDRALSGVRGQLGAANVAVGTFVGNVATSMVRAAVSMGGDLFRGTISSASSLNESISKTNTIFGSAAGDIIGNADRMSRTFGLSKQEMLDAAGVMGLMGKGAGMAGDDAAKFGNTMVNLAADAMSFYNVPMDQALEKIRAGLSGESEPLRAFGVFLTEDAVKAEALATGISKTGKNLTEGEKIMARASLIQKGLGAATGDLERTFSGTENQTRAFWGTLANLGQDIGGVLLPAFDMLLAGASSSMRSVSTYFAENKETVTGWVSSLMEGMSFVGVVWRNFGDIMEIARLQTVTTIANMILPIVAFGQNVATIAEYIGRNWYQLITDGLNATATAFQNFVTNMTGLGAAIFDFLSNPAGGFNFEWTPLLEGFQATVEKFPDLISPEIIDVDDQIAAIQGRMAGREAGRLGAPKVGAKSELQMLAESATRTAPTDAATAAGKEFKSEIIGSADFAAKLRLAQSSEDVPQKQLTELQQIREQDMRNGELLAKIADQSFGVLA